MDSIQFVLSHRLHQSTSAKAGQDALETQLQGLLKSADLISDSHAAQRDAVRGPLRRIVSLHGPHDLMRALRQDASLRPIIIEPRVEFQSHQSSLCMASGGRHVGVECTSDNKKTIQVRVTGDGLALAPAEVTLMYLDENGKTQLLPQKAVDDSGYCELEYGSNCTPLVVAAYPTFKYWTAFLKSPSDAVTLNCERLPDDGPVGWWHRFMGVHEYDASAGAGTKIGIIGMGVSNHPNLSHIIRVDGKTDLTSHGTHVCGLIAARPTAASEYCGIAPGAEVFTQRVFEMRPNGTVFSDQTKLAHAIDLFANEDSDCRVDLINLSLGSKDPSEIVADAIKHAYEQGIVCVSSAGNQSSAVEFPATMDETIAVSGLGLEDWGAANSVTTFMMPAESQSERFGDGGLYLANFSCFGDEICCGGPANGIVSTTSPTAAQVRPYGVMDGTSLSSPLVCGILARLIASSESLQKESGIHRAKALQRALLAYCRDIGLAPQFGGSGLLEFKPEFSPIRSSTD